MKSMVVILSMRGPLPSHWTTQPSSRTRSFSSSSRLESGEEEEERIREREKDKRGRGNGTESGKKTAFSPKCKCEVILSSCLLGP